MRCATHPILSHLKQLNTIPVVIANHTPAAAPVHPPASAACPPRLGWPPAAPPAPSPCWPAAAQTAPHPARIQHNRAACVCLCEQADALLHASPQPLCAQGDPTSGQVDMKLK